MMMQPMTIKTFLEIPFMKHDKCIRIACLKKIAITHNCTHCVKQLIYKKWKGNQSFSLRFMIYTVKLLESRKTTITYPSCARWSKNSVSQSYFWTLVMETIANVQKEYSCDHEPLYMEFTLMERMRQCTSNSFWHVLT